MFVKIEANQNGSHEFMSGGTLQDGWAYWDVDKVPMPASMPFVDIEVKMVLHPAVTETTKYEVNGEIIERTVILREAFERIEVISVTEREILEEQPLELGLSEEELQWQAITDLEIAQMEYDQALTDLEIAQLEGSTE